MGFVFYDTETTGTHKAFDQILQFAAIRTDDALNELERFEVRCRLLPHVVPAMGALRVTGMSIARITDPSLPSHFEMMRQIRAKMLAWSPAIFVGFNSVQFDEELLRQAFYQTLQPPYLTNTGGNSRADALSLVRLASYHHPGSIIVPTNDDTPVFKLDRLAPANGFAHEHAHDALGDVEATIQMCRLVRQRCPALWERFTRYSRKPAAEELVHGTHAFHLTEFYGNRPYPFVVAAFGRDAHGAALCLDLTADIDALAALSPAALAATLKASPSPVRRVKTNAAPNVAPLEGVSAGSLNGLTPSEIAARAQRLKADPSLAARLIATWAETRDPFEKSPHVEQQIYDGWTSNADQGRMSTFHNAQWEDRLAIVETFDDERLRRLGRRIVFWERPDLFAPEVRRAIATQVASRLLGQGDNVGDWNTLPKELAIVNAALAEDATNELARSLKDYLETHAARSVLSDELA